MAAGEGSETVLSLRCALPHPPVAAALSAAHLASMHFPATLRRLYIVRSAAGALRLSGQSRDPAFERAIGRQVAAQPAMAAADQFPARPITPVDLPHGACLGRFPSRSKLAGLRLLRCRCGPPLSLRVQVRTARRLSSPRRPRRSRPNRRRSTPMTSDRDDAAAAPGALNASPPAGPTIAGCRRSPSSPTGPAMPRPRHSSATIRCSRCCRSAAFLFPPILAIMTSRHGGGGGASSHSRGGRAPCC